MSVSSDGGGIQCPAQQAGNKGDSTQITCLDSDGGTAAQVISAAKAATHKIPYLDAQIAPKCPISLMIPNTLFSPVWSGRHFFRSNVWG